MSAGHTNAVYIKPIYFSFEVSFGEKSNEDATGDLCKFCAMTNVIKQACSTAEPLFLTNKGTFTIKCISSAFLPWNRQ